MEFPEADLEINVRRAHSPCGMHVPSGAYVEILHKPSGVAVAVKSGRSQMLDKRLALTALQVVLSAIVVEP